MAKYKPVHEAFKDFMESYVAFVMGETEPDIRGEEALQQNYKAWTDWHRRYCDKFFPEAERREVETQRADGDGTIKFTQVLHDTRIREAEQTFINFLNSVQLYILDTDTSKHIPLYGYKLPISGGDYYSVLQIGRVMSASDDARAKPILVRRKKLESWLAEHWPNTEATHPNLNTRGIRPSATALLTELCQRWPSNYAHPKNRWLEKAVERYCGMTRDRYRVLKKALLSDQTMPKSWAKAGQDGLPQMPDAKFTTLIEAIISRLSRR